MSNAIQSLLSTGTKLWLDSIDPNLIADNKALGATGATSNPIIVSDLLKSGRFDDSIRRRIDEGLSDDEIAWAMTDELVRNAQAEFVQIWQQTDGNDGYVSFEIDPLLEDPASDLPLSQRTERYIELGRKWAEGHRNRMIKIPATHAGLGALEELAANDVQLNVTLVFTADQYVAARDAVWRGAQRRRSLETFKSVYSIFVSRVDVYTAQHVDLPEELQGQVGIINAKRIWRENKDFWSNKGLKLEQEMIFASTGTKAATDAPWKYIAALAGSDIQTNPPATNAAVAASSESFTRQLAVPPSEQATQLIDEKLDVAKMREVLMREGIEKFATPQKTLLELIATKR
ncbi:MAG: transaldolase [Planctomycetota bacterium]|nr:transaldolase [Planctomycetota bacterium]